jgi:ABC-type sugar transport system permease subunit
MVQMFIKKKSTYAYMFVIPPIVIVAFIIVYPILYNVIVSFYEISFLEPSKFVFLDNYSSLLQSREFFVALRNTVIRTVGIVGSVLLLGLISAYFLSKGLKGSVAIKTLLIIPWIIPGVIVGFTWRFLLDPSFGMINDLLVRIGILDSYHYWLGDSRTSLFAIMIAFTWKIYPFSMIMYLAGLESIPVQLYEAAEIDGAKAWQKFAYITLPLLNSMTVVVTVITFLWAFNSFDLTFVMTGGGPLWSSEILPLFVYNKSFENLEYGMAASASFLMCLVWIGFFAWIIKRMIKGENLA